MESPFFKNILSFVAQNARYNKEMGVAKEEFERFAGPIFETDRSYDARINSFHNWYILDRPLRDVGSTPLVYFLEFNANSLPEHELAGYRELEHNLHSVFELVRLSNSQTRIRDLLTGRKFDVEGMEGTEFMDKGTLFNTRIFNHTGKFYFSNYFLTHPNGANKEIHKQARRVRKALVELKGFLFQLVLFQSRWDQYKQMELKNIYRFGS
ncbi:MAG: hypothetical protein OEW39_06555 [Deltaproteobacteria bacterium]|nr:hypothetical protein [Deltaproteobacteria bacterium]